ncbi:MAG: putative DNA binding domain-containing protein [Fibrobacterota bacterium]|nr:putative DNA binding domain-containing protein [Fibrobacterota bacterium]
MNTLGQILEAARIGESTDWEFKSAKGGFPGSFWDTYSAMANSEGGRVVLGVRERDGKSEVEGLSADQIDKFQKVLWDGLNDRGRVNLNLLESRHVQGVRFGELQLLVVEIPRATRLQRPIYKGGNPLGNTLRRRHEGDYHCTDAEVRRMFSDADDVPRDYRILNGFGLSDLDEPTLAQYRQLLQVAKVNHPWAGLPDKDLLEKLGGWRRDRVTGEEGLTLAGLLMFGKDQAIRDPDAAPAYFVDYREKLNPDIRWTDRIYPDGTWEANLFQFFHRVIPKLFNGLPTPFQLVGSVRRDYTPAHESLREAFVNALIHADYAAPGAVVVERYPDRILFHNPGTLLISEEQYRAGGVSECRNRALQQMFLFIGGGEKAGSGVDKINAGWRLNHWRPPSLITQVEPDRVTLLLPMLSLIPQEILSQLRGYFGAQVDSLPPEELQALATAQIEGAVSHSRLRELLTHHPVDISRMLQRLCEQGFLISDNRRRWSTYRLSKSVGPPSLFDGENQNSIPLAGNSIPLAGNSIPLAGNSIPLAEINENLRTIAAPLSVRSKAPQETIRKTILELCAGRFLSGEQLADLLNRNPVKLRHSFLTPMVKEGALKLRFPETANHPDQGYTASDPL